MRLRHLALGLCVFLYCFYVSASETTIRVRVLKSSHPISIKGHRVWTSWTLSQQSNLQPHYWSFRRLKKNGHWVWLLRNQKGEEFVEKNSRLYIRGDFLEVNHRMALPSGVKLVGKGGRIDVVIDLEMEEYLRGVIPNEMPLAWPEEALKAQAVASRSYAASVIRERKYLHFDVDSTVQDQVFQWVRRSRQIPNFRKKIDKVIEETKGQILVHGNENVYRAYFHADSGGVTELASYVWGGFNSQPSFSVRTNFANSPNLKWSRDWTGEDLGSLFFEKKLPVQNIRITSRSPSGRALSLELDFGDEKVVMSALDFRRTLGYSQLKSTRFEIEKQGNRFTFVGQGYGHGVGLCQWGARHLAVRKGYDYQNILKHYYPKTCLQTCQGDSNNKKQDSAYRNSFDKIELSNRFHMIAYRL